MSKEIMQQASWALKDLIAVYPETACIEIRISAQKVIATLEAAIDKSALEAELAKPEQSKHSDIVSDGGFDPRNKFDAQPEQEPNPKLKPTDLVIETYWVRRGFGAATPSGVSITHVPTGKSVRCESERSEHANKKLALQELEAALAQPEQELDYPPECTTPELEVAYAAGWWKALEVQRQQALDKKAANARELGLDYEPEQKFVDIHCPSCLHSFSVVPIAKREWVSLTELERRNLFKDVDWDNEDWACLAYARAIEAKLKEKNE